MDTLHALGQGFAGAMTLPHLWWALSGVALSLGTYLLFARLLQVSLPAGVLAPWL